MVFTFSCERDPSIGMPFELQFDSSRFVNVTAISTLGLFKFAALQMINEFEDSKMKEILSIKYQALCNETAMIGIIKQDTPNEIGRNDFKNSTLHFTRQVVQQDDFVLPDVLPPNIPP